MALAVTTITDPSGTDWILDGSNGIWEGRGKKGFHAPTYVHYRDRSPQVVGSFYRGVTVTERDLFLPVVITVPGDRDAALAKRRALINAISPLQGECVITSAWPDGSVRHIKCRYLEGMEAGEQGPGDYGITTMLYGLRFVADDPFMYGDLITTNWSLVPPTRTELPMPGADTFFEVVTSPLLAGGAVLNNAGSVDTYPEWTFEGPFTQIIAANTTTGKTWTITHTATLTGTLFLKTEPGETSLMDEAGVNRWDKLTAGYQLWPLRRGDNSVNITLTEATVDSAAMMTYRPLYESD